VINLRKPPARKTSLDEAIESLIKELDGHDGHSNEAKAIAENINTLAEANATLKGADTPDFVSAETLAVIAANLAGILMILSYEKANVLTSKALSFVLKAKS
jgi:hypothetical protein